jgi:histidinol-phosphate/aromatic aminotransferase/cobyric acid decarboxylase-like protein
VATVRENRSRFERELMERGLPALPSAANFVLVPVRSARTLADGLRANGVAVRAFPALPVVGDGIRISIGPWPMMQRALEALDACAHAWEGAGE